MMSRYLRLESEINLQAIENLYSELYSDSIRGNLVIPKEVKRNYLGNKAAFTQFIMTWVRRKDGSLFIYDPEDDKEKTIEELANNEFHSHAALVMSCAKRIFGYQSKKDLTEIAKKVCTQVLEKKIDQLIHMNIYPLANISKFISITKKNRPGAIVIYIDGSGASRSLTLT